MIKPKEGADILKGLQLSFEAARLRNLFRKHNGSQYHDDAVKAELERDKWFIKNLDGLPDQPAPIPPAEIN